MTSIALQAAMKLAEEILNGEDRWLPASVPFGRPITLDEFMAEIKRMREGYSLNSVWSRPCNGTMGWITNQPGYRGTPALELHYRHFLDRPPHYQDCIPTDFDPAWLEQFAWGFHPDQYAKEIPPERGWMAAFRRAGVWPYGSRAELEREAQEARDRNRPAWQKRGTDRVYW